jgi:molybdopterin converting factor small subunit
MKIKVKLYTILKKYAKGKVLKDDTINLHKDTTLQGLSRCLSIPENIGIIFLVNDSPQSKEFRLSEGEEVKMFTLICGG